MQRKYAKDRFSLSWRMITFLLLFTFALRLMHLAAALNSPFTFHLGPDEEYYLKFAAWLAGLTSGERAEFAFMDPAYGYILGLFFKIFGDNRAAILFFQCILDTITCLCIALSGKELGRPRAGFIAGMLYALTATALLYSTTFLKAAWVANAMAIWVYSALVLVRMERPLYWLLFGLFSGYCVALRGNLILLLPLAFILLPIVRMKRERVLYREVFSLQFVLVIGMLIPLLLLSARNMVYSEKFSPLPNNGGTVLHQVYNEDNPDASSWYPPFAPYTNPVDILRGYRTEAQTRTQRDLSPAEVDQYWREEALTYIKANPGAVASAMSRKALEFTSHSEVANNRSLVEERLFSLTLKSLPAPFGWLFALGLPGLLVLTWKDSRGLLVLAPLMVVAATFIVFFAESRFRFHAVPVLALGAGLFISQMIEWVKQGKGSGLFGGLAAVMLLGAVSFVGAETAPKPRVAWDAVAWGYIKMGDLAGARRALERAPDDYSGGAKWEEAKGFLAWNQNDLATATGHYRHATEINPGSHVAHYNLALLYQQQGMAQDAIRHARIAFRLAPLAEYRTLVDSLGQ